MTKLHDAQNKKRDREEEASNAAPADEVVPHDKEPLSK